MIHLRSHVLKLGACAVAIVALVSGAAYASIPDASGVIHTCYNGGKGTWRPVDYPTQKCNSGEQLLDVYAKGGADKTFFSVAGAGLEKTGQIASGPITVGIKNSGVVSSMLSGVSDPLGAAVTEKKIAVGAVTEPAIKVGAVTESKLAPDAVTAQNIAVGAVTAPALRVGAVTEAALATGPTTGAVTAPAIRVGAVTEPALAVGAVTAPALRVGAVTAPALDTGAVTSTAIQDGSVSNTDLTNSSLSVNAGTGLTGGGSVALGGSSTLGVATGGIGTTQLADGAVTTPKIADAAVTSAKIAANAVRTSELAANAVTTAEILNGTITADDLADGAVTSAKIASGAVRESELADGAVTTAKILDDTILTGDLSAAESTAPGQVLTSAADPTPTNPDHKKVVWGPVATVSDRNLKTSFSSLSPFDILQRLVSLRISSWSYKSEPGVRHIGPTAQDFAKAFRVGESNRRIAVVDADGVELASIQALNKMVKAQQQQISTLQKQNALLGRRLAKLERAGATRR